MHWLLSQAEGCFVRLVGCLAEPVNRIGKCPFNPDVAQHLREEFFADLKCKWFLKANSF